jgi:hypothetical protein
MNVHILEFVLDDVVWSVRCNAYIRMHCMSCSEGDTIVYSSFPKSIFVPSQKIDLIQNHYFFPKRNTFKFRVHRNQEMYG